MEDFVVLVVDRDEDSRRETAEAIGEALPSATVSTLDSRSAAEQRIETETVDVLVTGYVLPDGDGLELIEAVRSLSPGTTCLLYTHSETIDTESFEDVVVDFVGKDSPGAIETLLALVEEADETLLQASHPLPENEQQRVAAVERYEPGADADLGPYQRIVDLAVGHFEAAAATLSLIDRHQQRVLASAGAAVAPSTRDESIATHVLVQPDGTMAVGDTRVDPRFAEIETLQSAGIVAYLGATVETPDGVAIGALSVYDDDRREFTAEDHEFVRTLTDLASDLLQRDVRGETA